MKPRVVTWLTLLLAFGTAGCGRFVARRMMQSPNTYPTWFAPAAPVELAFDSAVLTNFPPHYLKVGPPPAQLHYRVVEPGDFCLNICSTNWTKKSRSHFVFTFHAKAPGATDARPHSPRGTVLLLHGYGLAQFAMAPWALQLAQDGWRCVLVDLRGHGKSTGSRIFFGLQETQDLSQLLDALTRTGQLTPPVAALGESYGAALALRWKTTEPRLGPVVAIAPYASLSNATLNLGREYARWVPQGFLKAGLKQLPALLKVEPSQLDTTTLLTHHQVSALMVAGTKDKIMPLDAVRSVFDLAAPDSELLEVPGATHEAVPYYFDDLIAPVRGWLNRHCETAHTLGAD
jgi:pimeloyl-ACP methyl ester carboxylesterase